MSAFSTNAETLDAALSCMLGARRMVDDGAESSGAAALPVQGHCSTPFYSDLATLMLVAAAMETGKD
jgi:hypothetical protein